MCSFAQQVAGTARQDNARRKPSGKEGGAGTQAVMKMRKEKMEGL